MLLTIHLLQALYLGHFGRSIAYAFRISIPVSPLYSSTDVKHKLKSKYSYQVPHPESWKPRIFRKRHPAEVESGQRRGKESKAVVLPGFV